jgi:thiol-disulfide isomerase/thioredoxin
MKRALYILSLAIVSFTSQLSWAAGKTINAPKPQLQAIASTNVFQGDVSKSDVTVIQFWASWCTGCGVVMAQISELTAQHPTMGYVSVSLDETKETALKFFANKSPATQQMITKSFLDPSGQSFAELNHVESLPYLIVVDKSGHVLKRIQGHPSKSDVEFLIKKDSHS